MGGWVENEGEGGTSATLLGPGRGVELSQRPENGRGHGAGRRERRHQGGAEAQQPERGAAEALDVEMKARLPRNFFDTTDYDHWLRTDYRSDLDEEVFGKLEPAEALDIISRYESTEKAQEG